ncbi:MAG TPA: peptidylprolyl isomerase [Polaromonas sp.]|uniref:peptidylprolyl isomerase n=1 Tax=Polaromonas sp. UBA4122 TaxID=1947074 RepID=UPI000EE6FC41|nr:peptidylprolyl isomerase [Polaromonas sp. UBA4122]HAL37679.1 peptidylprolyl isomerase [Polaromonas sp.]
MKFPRPLATFRQLSKVGPSVNTLRRAWLAAATITCLISLAGPALAQGAPKVKFVTSEGDFVVEVYPDKAPKTVENFLQYVKDKYYDGTIFHRVINNFMVQGGGFDASYAQKPTRAPVVHEGREALAKGGDKNVLGTLAMARTNEPNSASSQFFINVKDNDFLNPTPQSYGYTVFGKVVSGMDVVNKIKSVPTGAAGPFRSDVPKTPILIKSATLVN